MIELVDCPFCGKGQTTAELNTWKPPPGKKGEPARPPVVSFIIRHWCTKRPGTSHAYFEIRASDEDHAVKQWNSRSSKS